MSDGPPAPGERPPAGLPKTDALSRAGWSEEELTWEQVQEAASEALLAGDWRQAGSLWTVALDIARITFEASDPRLATSLVNKAVAARHSGKETAAANLFDEALAVWACSGPWVLALAPERRARSSTFHLRLERRHRGGYDRQARARYTALAEEGHAATKALKSGDRSPRGSLERWRRERPAGFVDVRKLLAAVLLLADPPA